MKNIRSLSKSAFIFIGVLIVLFATFLRLYNLSHLPSSPYWEEVALGYDAFSILKTGKDHHGNAFPVVSFTSFGDYKPSGYFYALVPFIALFGLTVEAVRMPSALAGIATVIGMGFFVRFFTELLWPKEQLRFYRLSQLLGMIIATISAWLIQFSRGGWEVNLATSLLLWSVVLGLNVTTSQSKTFLKMFGSVLLAALSMYVYHSTRVVAPLVMASMFLLWATPILSEKQNWNINGFVLLFKKYAIPAVLFLLFAFPILKSSGDATTQQRFAETSISSDGQYVKDSNYFREQAGPSNIAKLATQRYVLLGQEIVVSFASHFSPDFLFISGDKNPRHSTGFTGILSITDGVWLIIGIIAISTALLRNKKAGPFILFLGWWLFIGILPAALTKATPHALRILPTAPIFLTVVCLGVMASFLWLTTHFSRKIYVGLILCTAVIIGGYWLSYWRFYTKIYPVESEADWQYGYEQMVAQLNTAMKDHPQTPVFVTREYGRPAMYYWFYTQTPPSEVQAEESTAKKDQGEFVSFKNIEFINTVNEAKSGIVVSSESGYEQLLKDFSSVQKLNEVKDLQGKTVWIEALVSDQPQTPQPSK